MKSFAKKFLSIALAAVLLLGVLPMAAFAAEEHTVIFYRNDEKTEIKRMTVAHDYVLTAEDIPATSAPAYAKGAQKGWRYLKGENYYEGQKIVADTNLVDDYDLEQFTVTFYADDEKTVIGSTVVDGGAAIAPNMFPDKNKPANGDKFLGWRYLMGTNYYEGGAIEGATNLVADWSLIVEVPVPDYTVTFYGNDEVTVLGTKVVKEGYVLKAEDFPTLKKPENTGNWIGWRYLKGKNYYEGQNIVADTNLVADYEELKPAVYHTVKVSGTSAELTVKEGSKLTESQIQTLKDSVKVPTGKKLDSLRDANNAVLDTNTVISADLVVTPYFVDDPNYNPRPDGADWYYTIHMDEGWTNGAKYDAPKQIQQNQRFGIVFKSDKNVNGTLPVPSRNLHVFRGWYLVDEEGYMTTKKVDAETIFDEGRHVTLRAKWEREAEVYLRIYRNGNVTTPYTIQPLYGYAEGETIYTKDLKIGDYYKNGGKPFDFDGWYDRGGWTLFKAKDNPKPISAIKASEVGGQTILYCMITDSNAPSNKTPDHTNPKTGDESMIIATTAVMLVSAGALAVFFMDRKRRNG